MDFYTFSLGLGVVGLLAMALGGMARHVGHSAGGHTAGGHAQGHGVTHGHGPLHGLTQGHRTAGGHGFLSGHASAPAHGHAPAHGLAPVSGHPPAAGQAAAQSFFESYLGWLLSPRVLFGISLGLGTAGVVLRHQFGGGLLFLVALVVGVLFERLLLTPLGNFALRFASRPALTLEAAVSGEATAVTTFDGDGHGIVQIDLDGQLVQVLATLTSRDRALGHRVRAGETLRVEDVDPDRNRCRVTLI